MNDSAFLIEHDSSSDPVSDVESNASPVPGATVIAIRDSIKSLVQAAIDADALKSKNDAQNPKLETVNADMQTVLVKEALGTTDTFSVPTNAVDEGNTSFLTFLKIFATFLVAHPIMDQDDDRTLIVPAQDAVLPANSDKEVFFMAHSNLFKRKLQQLLMKCLRRMISRR